MDIPRSVKAKPSLAVDSGLHVFRIQVDKSTTYSLTHKPFGIGIGICYSLHVIS
jgi:hypothetical protein